MAQVTIEWDPVRINSKWTADISKKIQEVIVDVCTKAGEELIPVLHEDFERMFQETIEEFYDSYDPIFYGRHESLYNIMEIADDGANFSWGFIPDRATPLERSGGSVYDLAFKQGYHGGATGTDHNGNTRDYMSWRMPYGVYRWWGDAAAKTVPPLDVWNRRVENYKATTAVQKCRDLIRKNSNGVIQFT